MGIAESLTAAAQQCPSAGSQVGDVDISPSWPGSGKCLKALPPFLHQRLDSNILIMLFPQGLRELFKTRALTKPDLGSQAMWGCKARPWEAARHSLLALGEAFQGL